jgi:26S proteasome regulatory subunit T5
MDLEGVFDDDDGTNLVLDDLKQASTEDILTRVRLLENELRVLRDDANRLQLDLGSEKERVRDGLEKVKLNKQLPYLVASIVEVLDLKAEGTFRERECCCRCFAVVVVVVASML